jgi:nucleoside-diphosphate-sugar epimerase
MKVVVTGGTGFLGRHTVWRLAAEGMEVVFTGRNRQAAAEVVGLSPAPVRWAELWHGRDDSAATLARAASGAGALVHCAALSAPWGDPATFHRANVLATVEVVAACASCGIPRLVHISTPGLYFDFKDRIGIREDHPLPEPANEYIRTKGIAETIVREAAIPETVILRPRALFGPWDATLMPRFLRVLSRGAVPLIHGGRALLDLTYISNAAGAIHSALTQKLPNHLCTYNLSNGTPLPFHELVEKVAAAFQLRRRTRRVPWLLAKALAAFSETSARLVHGREPPLTRYGAGILAFSQTLDIGAISRDLGYSPQVSIEQGLQIHAEWWRSHQGGALAGCTR